MRWKHRMVEAMCDRFPEEPAVSDGKLIATTVWPPTTFPECMRAERESMRQMWDQHVAEAVRREFNENLPSDICGEDDEPESARGDCEDRSDVTAEVQPADDMRQAESET